MNDTTKWIMIILLLLLIGAAVFMLLRSPGKENGEADVPPADADRDGVADARAGGTGAVTGADRGVYDQEAEAAPAEPVADEPAYETVADEPVADERAYDEPAPEVYEAEPEARPLSDEEIEAGGREEPLDTADQEPVVEEPAPTSGTFHQETLPTEEAPAEDHAPAQEYPVGEESTTYRADDGAAARVDEPAGDASGTDTVTPAPADAGGGAPQTADDIVAGVDAAGTRDASGTADTGYAPIFAEAAYGPGSAEPLEDGTGPAGWQIKGNAGSMLFHTPESPSYDDVRAEVWFESEEAARAAGFAHWDRRQR